MRPSTMSTVSLNDLFEPFARKFGAALAESGFVALTDHGIDRPLVDAFYVAAAEAFSLPEERKALCRTPEDGTASGYTPRGPEGAASWHLCRFDAKVPNLWPEDVPAFRRTASVLFMALENLSCHLLRGLDLFLEQPPRTFAEEVMGGPSFLRPLWYPDVATGRTDIDLITLLAPATGSGLEFLQCDGSWLPVAAPRGALIVNAGEMLEILTRTMPKEIPAPTYRQAEAKDAGGCYSAPFYVQPRPEMHLSVIPRYTAGSYLEQRLRCLRVR